MLYVLVLPFCIVIKNAQYMTITLFYWVLSCFKRCWHPQQRIQCYFVGNQMSFCALFRDILVKILSFCLLYIIGICSLVLYFLLIRMLLMANVTASNVCFQWRLLRRVVPLVSSFTIAVEQHLLQRTTSHLSSKWGQWQIGFREVVCKEPFLFLLHVTHFESKKFCPSSKKKDSRYGTRFSISE